MLAPIVKVPLGQDSRFKGIPYVLGISGKIVKYTKHPAVAGIRITDEFSRLNGLRKWGSIILLSLLCAACTNSRLVLRPLYNSVDDRIEERFFEYTKYTPEQTQQIKELVDHFHVWHRKSQLQYYSALLGDVTSHLNDTKSVNEDDITRWSESINTYRSSLITCNPFYAATDILVSLTDEQINEIRDARQARRDARRQRRAQEDENEGEQILEESNSGRIKQIKRYLRFINFSLNKEQLDDLSNTMSLTMRPETSFGPIREKYDAEFYNLLDNRSDANFDKQLADLLNDRTQAIFDWREKSREHNSTLWEAYALRTFQSLDETQRDAASDYLNGMISTINALASDEPSYRKKSASDYACLGEEISL